MPNYKAFPKYTFLAALALMVMTQVFAATARPINYQGYLAQPDGTPIDTSVAMTVELWTAVTAGTLLYSETHAAVTVSKGRFSIEISTGTPVNGTFNADQFQQDTWLALTINGELLNPRSRLGAVAGSQHSEIADRLSTSCADGEWLGFRNGVLNCYGCFPDDNIAGCYEGDPVTEGIGACRSGRNNCVDGAYASACTGQVLPVAESCNSVDDNCNGLVDDGTSLPGCVILFIDNDGDGFGSASTGEACLCPEAPAPGTSNIGGDCDDTDIRVKPDQASYFTELSNGGSFDYNCNSVIEKQYSQPVATCTYNGSSCDYVPGFKDSIPACGTWGTESSGCLQEGTVCSVTGGVVYRKMGCL